MGFSGFLFCYKDMNCRGIVLKKLYEKNENDQEIAEPSLILVRYSKRSKCVLVSNNNFFYKKIEI